MTSRPWILPVALAVAFALLWGATAAWPFLGATFAALSAAALVWAFAAAVWPRMRRLRRDPYDLDSLRELHEREELREIEHDDVEYDSVVCLHCQAVYSNRLPACPRCGHSF